MDISSVKQNYFFMDIISVINFFSGYSLVRIYAIYTSYTFVLCESNFRLKQRSRIVQTGNNLNETNMNIKKFGAKISMSITLIP